MAQANTPSFTDATSTQPRSGPLAGVRIVDLTSVGMGPYATQIFGDMGAEVIKVEAPEGDVFRQPAPARTPGMSAIFLNLNRNKKCVTLDLKQADDLATLKALIDTADVFISNVRPKALKKLGLDYELLAMTHPRLIYCAAVGFGQSGPYAAKPAFDDIIQAMSGLAALQGAATGTPSYINTIIADKVTGLTLAYAVPMALYEREKSGRGQAIEVPMFETLVSFSMIEHMGGRTFEPAEGGMGYSRVLSAHRRPYRTADGFIGLLPYTDGQWQRFFDIAGRADLATDPRFGSAQRRSEHYDVLYEELAAIVLTRTTDDWLVQLEAADIPVARVMELDDLLDDPHLQATGFFVERDHPTEGRVRQMNVPVSFSRTPGRIDTLAERQGTSQHDVLRELPSPRVATEEQ
ncbi:CaiB/BaiF CoA transferase family protein [Paraburkholderia antibiotica]|uniref:CaiB/BaiF CoA transferase family protein n=1 Tax=Paraburkholderia antibiotica TaxID=2728839 RepID=UPI0022A8616D|nr:CoA transferase [Paraburkholderia antibiotica]